MTEKRKRRRMREDEKNPEGQNIAPANAECRLTTQSTEATCKYETPTFSREKRHQRDAEKQNWSLTYALAAVASCRMDRVTNPFQMDGNWEVAVAYSVADSVIFLASEARPHRWGVPDQPVLHCHSHPLRPCSLSTYFAALFGAAGVCCRCGT
eukprot:scaffold286601_cov59-Attheya_sp.AAC.7